MPKRHVKKGDVVVVISGEHKGARGRIIEVQGEKQRVLVEGVNMLKKTIKKGRSQLHPNGAIIEREGPVHLSNVIRADRYDARHGGKTEEAKA